MGGQSARFRFASSRCMLSPNELEPTCFACYEQKRPESGMKINFPPFSDLFYSIWLRQIGSNSLGSLSLKLYRSGWFTGQIIEYSINPFHLIDDSIHHLLKYFKRNLRAFCSHKVCCIDCSQGYCIVIGSEIAHDTYGAHIGQCCKVLPLF